MYTIGVLEVQKTHQWYQRLGLFSVILDATCVYSMKNRIFGFLDSGLAESMHITDQLADFVHTLDELELHNVDFRGFWLELD